MDQHGSTPGGPGGAGSANTPPFRPEPPAVRSAPDHQIPSDTGGTISGRTETERELERTRDMMAETAAPVVADKVQDAITEAADRIQHDPRMQDQMKRTASAVQHDAQRAVQDKVGEVRDQVEQRANEKKDQIADKLDQAARRIDRLADERTTGATGAKAQAGQMAHSVADTMESVAGYLRSNDVATFQRDLERQVRQSPLQTLLIGVAAGWVVGKILR